jgi:hypothetical protein
MPYIFEIIEILSIYSFVILPKYMCIFSSKPFNRTFFSLFEIVLMINCLSYVKKKKLPLFPPSLCLSPWLDLKIWNIFLLGSKEFMISYSSIPSIYLNCLKRSETYDFICIFTYTILILKSEHYNECFLINFYNILYFIT